MSQNEITPPRRMRHVLKRFRRNQDGGAAIEFALVAMPFVALMVLIVELGVFFFATRYFEDGMFNASRKIMTQRLPAASICAAFQSEIAANFPSWLDPNLVALTVREGTNFSSSSTVNMGGGGCTFGASQKVVTVTATYPYPFAGVRTVAGGAFWGAGNNLSISTAFRVE